VLQLPPLRCSTVLYVQYTRRPNFWKEGPAFEGAEVDAARHHPLLQPAIPPAFMVGVEGLEYGSSFRPGFRVYGSGFECSVEDLCFRV